MLQNMSPIVSQRATYTPKILGKQKAYNRVLSSIDYGPTKRQIRLTTPVQNHHDLAFTLSSLSWKGFQANSSIVSESPILNDGWKLLNLGTNLVYDVSSPSNLFVSSPARILPTNVVERVWESHPGRVITRQDHHDNDDEHSSICAGSSSLNPFHCQAEALQHPMKEYSTTHWSVTTSRSQMTSKTLSQPLVLCPLLIPQSLALEPYHSYKLSKHSASSTKWNFARLPSHTSRCHFSSSSAAVDNVSKSSNEEHDRRVAAVQAKILARIQKGQQHKPPPTKRNLPTTIKSEDVHHIMQSIRHWLLKDVNFFVATMEAMDISLLESDKNAMVNAAAAVDNNNAKSNSKSRKRTRNSSTEESSHLFLSGHHPMQMILDQYRQLYYDSIPEFEDVMQRNDHAFLKEHNILQQLSAAGFTDPQWSRSFRRVRGYQIQQDALVRTRAKQAVDLQRQEATLAKAQQELKEYDSLERLFANADPEISLRRQKKTSHKKKVGSTSTMKPTQEPPSILAEKPEPSPPQQNILQAAWANLSSLWGAKPAGTTENVDKDTQTTSPAKSKPSPDTQLDKDDENTKEQLPSKPSSQKLSKPVSSSAKGLQKKILQKQDAIRRLEDQVEQAVTRLHHTERQLRSLEVPLSDEEYENGQAIVSKVQDVLCKEFAKHMQERHAHLIAQYETLNSKTDLTKPQEWFPYARLDRRKIIFHGGPTNSGKTYTALQRLKQAENGLYLGPLRLLAAEIYETLTTEGLYTNLHTGQERREIAFSTHTSSTVEMFTATKEYDVVVIDEIQMLADPTRGAAWTRALLGLRCKEIHVCGGLEAKNVVEKLAKACGDEFELHTYTRFTELRVAEKSLASNFKKTGAYRNVQPGDCVVAFSRNDIFAIKREIENTTNFKCCVIYGKLPPQTRADQARRFNDPDSGYDILVASDAIGMGLNLNIRRIIFNSIFKFNGDKIVRLGHSDVKQISGRAGRRNSPYPLGEVTCRDSRDLPFIRECLSTDIAPIEKAGLLPTAAHIELFSEAVSAYEAGKEEELFPDLHQVLKQFNAMATVKGDYFLGRQHELQMIAKRIKTIPLSLRDAYIMCLSPTTENSLELLENFAWKHCRGEVPGLSSRKVPKRASSFEDLSNLCGIYADADLFLWLGLKFPPSNAVEQAAAIARKEQTLEYINEALATSENLKLSHCYLRQANRLRNSWEAQNGRSRDVGLYDGDSDDEDDDDDDDDYLCG
jgi:ATP-dependent RNA helicase SUPV3L1/SUV3